MSTSEHHGEESALDQLLAAYAAGTLPRALHALVGAHLEISPTNRRFVAALEASMALRIAAAEPGVMRARDARLTSILSLPVGAPEAEPAETGLPAALYQFLGQPIDALAFRQVLPGLREHRAETGDETRAILYRIRPGRKMPQHSHDGTEVTLVLKGGFSDRSGHFRRGDLVIADQHVDHVPVADADEECICFAVLDAPLRLTGKFGRLINRFVSH